jgi:threonine dehydrogenase-like Zn-dependent dehydrogenase
VEGFRPGDRALVFGNHASHVLADMSDLQAWRSYPDRLPDGVTDEQACYAVLGDVALHGVRRGTLQIDESIAIFGVGVVGQLTVQFVRLSGAHPIVAVDLYQRRLELARQGGATHTVDASQEDSVAAVLAATGGGAQTVFHCSPVAQLLQTTLRAAGMRGKVVLTGSAPGTAEIGLQVELLRRELTILGNYETGLHEPHAYWPWTRQRNRAACYRLIAGGQLAVDQLTSHVVPPRRAEEMYRMMAAGGDGWMSVFFDWS